jgi:hypothetical protein
MESPVNLETFYVLTTLWLVGGRLEGHNVVISREHFPACINETRSDGNGQIIRFCTTRVLRQSGRAS